MLLLSVVVSGRERRDDASATRATDKARHGGLDYGDGSRDNETGGTGNGRWKYSKIETSERTERRSCLFCCFGQVVLYRSSVTLSSVRNKSISVTCFRR